MAKLIKKGSRDLGDISPDTGLADGVASGSRVISGKKFEAKAQADGIVERAEGRAQQILEDAREEAANILEQAAGEAEQLKEQAHAQGLDEGKQEGAAQLAEIVGGASQRLRHIEEQAVPQLKELALSIARKILGRELEFAPESVVDIVKQALSDKARLRREIFLRVHPDDLGAIREQKPELLEVLSRCKEIGIREDPEVERFGVIIETDAGVIDAQLETQLAAFERVLKDA